MRASLVIVIAASIVLALARADAGEQSSTPAVRPAPAKRPPQTSPVVQEPSQNTVKLPDELRARIVADAAKRAKVSETQVRIHAAEARTWPDGALGCPQPKGVYTQMLESGYQVWVEAGAETFDYRAASRGHFLLCPTRFPFITEPPLPKEPTRR